MADLKATWRRATQRYRDRHIAAGRCLGCGENARELYCPVCKDDRRVYQRHYMRRMRQRQREMTCQTA